ncbi:amidohydrolase family protein [Lysobacter gummosus]|uniref:amidohydrolase family protein n=1 Tax=Lysobacter gummosus TaxID=262324 RepID=UPI0036354996
MAGMAERQTNPADSFWTWRETMYRFAERFTPEALHAVATQLYVEMLEAGYTSVCEFHYLHHAPDGRAYADPAEMSRALIAAARDTGIRMTLLPVLYMTGGFDERPLSERQRRFGHTVDAYLRLLDALRAESDQLLRVGCCLHSLRAVPPAPMREVLAALPADSRVHVHIAEQVAEVEDCLALRHARPVEWLLANAQVDQRWTLVHATHLNEAEVQGIAASGATVAVCTTTEANLGDGFFRCAITWMPAGIGAWDRIRISRFRRSRNCAGWSTGSACSRGVETSRSARAAPVSARLCCRACMRARSVRPAIRRRVWPATP